MIIVGLQNKSTLLMVRIWLNLDLLGYGREKKDFFGKCGTNTCTSKLFEFQNMPSYNGEMVSSGHSEGLNARSTSFNILEAEHYLTKLFVSFWVYHHS